MHVFSHFLRQVFLCCLIILKYYESVAQCKQNYSWVDWENFSGNKATGTIVSGTKEIKVNMVANYPIPSTTNIFNFGVFSKFSEYATILNSTVARVPWAKDGKLTICFSEPVKNPVLLIASLGNTKTSVALHFSEPYTIFYDAGGITYLDPYSLNGLEGNTIILFPGVFTCLTIYSETPESSYITWGLQIPLFPVTISDSIRECASVTLTANGGKSYKWSGGLNTANAVNTVTTTGAYSVTVTDQNGCSAIALKKVTSIPKTILKETVSKTICQGESFAGYTASGTYVDSLKTRYGCDSIRTLNLSVLATPTIGFGNNKVICNGQTVELRPASTSLPYTYKWSTNETTPTILAKSAGIYSVTVVNGICSSVASTSVTVNPTPTILPNETKTCEDNVLVAGGLDSNLSYLWEPSEETTPTITVHQPGTYIVKITNGFNCSTARTIQITGSCLTNVFAPDSFTPNQDQMNDTFKLFVKNGTQLGLTIYNRWGDVLYSETGATAQWDGKYKGDDCLTGMYGYKLTYKASGSDEVLEHKGTVLLVR